MLVVEDMVLAEAVVSGAAGAVAEFQVGDIRVGPAADGALVSVALLGLLLLLPADGAFKLDGLMGVPVPGEAPPPVHLVHDVAPEENQEVEEGDDGQQGAEEVHAEQRPDHVHGEEARVRQGNHLAFTGMM